MDKPQSLKSGVHNGMVKAAYMSLQSLYCLKGAPTSAHEINATSPTVMGKVCCSAECPATLTHLIPDSMDLQVMLQP